ncbi:hypothetical protein [Leclercia adecarboxylata]|uniref:hypothetical protein n=1 Tax=Leclercia adecarboxylata TaxID=83655 RepID=UPI00294A7123|nr:hypothetical protein [Leclercia adecarboxylata]MDV5239543.1 hypothetical protein [Leclercia adecarboxylata]MDV5276106.1 hypothetical protein [Leclercia adecarboxylata]MDV5461310.1 hypothetical protein [Leclercia adecarboxylata]MDV5503543.1 hypothetical protein [Leclercia adecarboxylata]MDV5532921.1 hypothetical protein [Leclercia adecarboxylata]
MAYLQITLDISNENRAAAAGIYQNYKTPFLTTIDGATSKELLIREQDVQVLHGFKTVAQAQAYLNSPLFTQDVVAGLKPYLNSAPDVRIYDAM